MSWHVKEDDRKRHIYLSGKTQYGKTTTMLAMALQDIKNDQGVCFIDAKGKDLPTLLDWIPARRRNDVIYLDLETPIPMDFMATKSHKERMRLVSDIVQIFERMEEGLGVRMKGILRFTVTALHTMGSPCFMDIYHVLTDESVRDRIRKHPAIQSDPAQASFWNTLAEKTIKGESGVAIAISRMSNFILSDAFNIILGTREAELKIDKAIEEKKVILVRLEPNSDEAMVYGSLIVSKIQQAIFRRDPLNPNNPPFALYVDEFQTFKSSGFEETLAQGGGLGLYLTLANQYFDQLSDSNLEKAIINCVSTFFLFRMNPSNAGDLKYELKELPPPPKYVPPLEPDKKAIMDRIDLSKRRLDNIYGASLRRTIHGFDTTEQDAAAKEAKAELARWEKILEDAYNAPPPSDPLPPPLKFIEQLPFLQPGQAVYRAADGTTSIIRTPEPPPSLESVGKTSHAEHIKSETLRIYGPKSDPSAEIGQNRSGEKSACNSPSEPHTEGDGNTDTIKASGSPTAPDFRKKKNS